MTRRPPIAALLTLALALPLAVPADTPTAKSKGEPTVSQLLAAVEFGDPEQEKALLDLVRRRPAAVDEVVERVRKWLAAKELTDAEERRLRAAVQLLGEEPKVEAALAEVLTGAKTPRATRRLAIRALGQFGSRPPQAWLDGLARALDDADAQVRGEAIYAIHTLDLRSFDERLAALANTPGEPLELRVAALACVAPRNPAVANEAYPLLRRQLGPDADAVVRLTAARAVGASKLSNAHLLDLARALPKLPATSGVLALAAFQKATDAEIALAAVAGLKDAPALRQLGEADLERLFIAYPEEVRKAVDPLRERLAEVSRQQRDLLARVEAELPSGDPKRGRAVFFADRAVACATCHRAQGAGGTLGPNLSRISRIRSPHELLRSILHPSAYVAPFFRAYLATLKDGRVVTGMLVQESVDAVYLRSGTNLITRVPRRQIEDLQVSRTSLMPDGFDLLLSRKELGDLMAFLAVLR